MGKIKNGKNLLSKRKNKSTGIKTRHKLKNFMNMGHDLAFSNQDALPSLASIAMNETHIPSTKQLKRSKTTKSHRNNPKRLVRQTLQNTVSEPYRMRGHSVSLSQSQTDIVQVSTMNT